MILRSDRIDARLALAFDLAAGRYLAAVQGRVDNYLVERRRPVRGHHQSRHDQRPGRLRPAGAGSPRAAGGSPTRPSRACSAASARSPPTSTWRPSGIIRVSDVRLAAPQLARAHRRRRLPAGRDDRPAPRRRQQRLRPARGPRHRPRQRAAGSSSPPPARATASPTSPPPSAPPRRAGRSTRAAIRLTGRSPPTSSSSPTAARSPSPSTG